MSEALGFSEAAADWIRRNRASLPEDLRPAPEDLEAFAHLFVSYLATSYEVVDGAMVRACGGCWCCVYWVGNRHLRARNPDRKAKGVAHELKVLALRRMSEELGLPLVDRDFDPVLSKRRPAVALFAYAVELDRRSRFASQGEGVLALWREVAWTPEGKPRPNFRLKVSEILKAEAELAAALQALA